ncbi:calcineurin responsive transcription factor prz1 [Phaffia rhodozyma]|uniref:Calcineurin responsive transcription factor prz1 n=1 Tax=Phaffia rhodozyma TaxID=264483 RepID=A0A0F7SKY1_PHARH|nr:calcineurin responsive transcription factor prz1 [Phaffia rhodozyma]
MQQQMQQQMQPVDFYQSQSQLSTLSPSLNPSSSVHHQSLDGKPRRTSFGGGTFGAGTPNYGQGLLNPWAGMSGLPAGEHVALGMPGPGVQRSLSDAGSNRISHRKVKSVDLSSSPYLGVPNNPSRSPRHRSPSRPTSTASSSSTVPVSNSSSDVKSLPMSSYAGLNSHSGLSPTQDLVQMDMNMFDSDEDDGDTDPDGPSIMLTPLSEVSASGGAGGSEELNVRKQSVTTNKTANASKSRRKVVAHFICPIPGCGTTFTRSFNLKGHLRSHTDERPFKCETCGKGFARQHDCKRHMALHVGYRPHSCVGCKKKFARLDALSRHLKSDAGQECLRVAETSALASDTDPEADIEETLEKADSLGGSESSSPPAERDRRMPTRGMSGVLL